MESKKGASFPFLVIAIILGAALYKQFNFETLQFKKPALAVIYLICFVFAVVVLIKGLIRQSKK